MKKALYFFQYLPPWKIDVFNGMARHYDLTAVFFDIEREGFTYDRKDLLGRLRSVGVETLSHGFKLQGHTVRFGILRLLRKYRPEVVFVHEFSSVTVSLLIWRKRFKYRLYITTSDNLAMAASTHGLVHQVRDYVFSHADGAIFYSSQVQDYYRKRYPALKSAVCPNIQDPGTLLCYRPQFPDIIRSRKEWLPEGTRLILYVGRLVGVKGLDLLLDAFARWNKPGYRLVLVGEGRERDALVKQAATLGIEDRILFAGFSSGAELYAWYEMADFFVLPSRYEPFGAVVNEALVYGCPVVASRYIGALDFIDGENGFLFDPLDGDDFVRALEDASARFTGSGPREDRMPLSFDDTVKAYMEIDEK